MNQPIITDNTIRIPSSQNHLVAVDEFLEGRLREWGVDESTIADIAISVSEVVNNGIIHGNKNDPTKVVTLSLERRGDDLTFVVRDQGVGFDPAAVADPLATSNLMREVGRGIFIVKSLMDSVDIKITTEGVVVTMTKKTGA